MKIMIIINKQIIINLIVANIILHKNQHHIKLLRVTIPLAN